MEKITLTNEQEHIIEDYCRDNMKKLKKLCNPVISRKGVPDSELDDLYSEAMNTLLESVQSFDRNKNCSFQTFLIGNIKRAFYEWTRDKRRGKRCNVERNKDGTIKKDEGGNPFVIKDKSLDDQTEDGIDMSEKIPTVDNSLDEILGCDIRGTRIESYLQKLSSMQRNVVKLLADGYNAKEIRKLLNITKKQYSECVLAIQAYENIRCLL